MPKRRRINWVFSDIVRWFLKTKFEWRAKLRGEAFHCSALSGEAEYKITINCDGTMTCNCQDYDGSGTLGDLNQQSFKDIFFGAKAESFRQALAKGKLPIDTCARCGDLRRIKKSKLHEIKPRLPYRGILLENTVHCNIDCLGCDRKQAAGLRKTKLMELDKLAKKTDLVKELGLQQLFYLNRGGPGGAPGGGGGGPGGRGGGPGGRRGVS